MRYSICLFTAVLFLLGCRAKPAPTETAASKNSGTLLKPLARGVVIDSVICAGDASQIYSIYLPTKYDTTKKWPIIYFFDPHGVGNLPVKLYKELAEKYGFILAGTYNSQNGTSFDVSEKAAQAFMKDTWLRLSLNDKRLYTFGFSGGAKVASMVAINDGGIAGVVACGGGFPEQHPQLKQSFSFISFVGNKDFNNMTVRQLDKLLESTALPHQLIVFNGKHQWTPPSYIEEAFQWLDLDAMRMKTMPKNDSIIKSIKERFLTEAEKFNKQKNTVQEYYTYKKLLSFLRDLDDMGKYAEKVQEMEHSQALVKYFNDEEAFDAQEAQEILEFRAHLTKMDQPWWDNKISIMKNIVARDSASPVALQTQRMLSYLSLIMYMGASQEFNNRQYADAGYFVGLYAMVDPQNPEHSYLSACLAMTDNKPDKALDMLKDAVKLGFSDSKRLAQDSNFVSLHDKSEYKKLLSEMASRPEKLDMTK